MTDSAPWPHPSAAKKAFARQTSRPHCTHEVLPAELIALFEDQASWRDSRKTLKRKFDNKGQFLYAKVHQNVQLYRNLYRYLVYRFPSPANLKRCTEELLR